MNQRARLRLQCFKIRIGNPTIFLKSISYRRLLDQGSNVEVDAKSFAGMHLSPGPVINPAMFVFPKPPMTCIYKMHMKWWYSILQGEKSSIKTLSATLTQDGIGCQRQGMANTSSTRSGRKICLQHDGQMFYPRVHFCHSSRALYRVTKFDDYWYSVQSWVPIKSWLWLWLSNARCASNPYKAKNKPTEYSIRGKETPATSYARNSNRAITIAPGRPSPKI